MPRSFFIYSSPLLSSLYMLPIYAIGDAINSPVDYASPSLYAYLFLPRIYLDISFFHVVSDF